MMPATMSQRKKDFMPSSPGYHSDGPTKSSTIQLGAPWSAKLLPPEKPSGLLRDDYRHVGDAYHRDQGEACEWEKRDLGSKKMPYLAHIKSLARTWKSLRYLADWMQVGTTPLRFSEFESGDEMQRKRKTCVTFLEFQRGAAPDPHEIKSAVVLKDFVDSLSCGPNEKAPMRLFVVEDLSQEVIEILGARFDIDPMCFRDQVDDYVWNNVRDPWTQPSSLMSSIKHRQWFRVRNARLRYHKDRDDYRGAWLEANSWNVQRRPEDDENRWNYSDEPGSIVSTMRTRTTMWIGQDKMCGNGTVGILLVDPTLSYGTPLWFDRSNWLPLPKMDAPPPPAAATQTGSWAKDIINATCTFPWFEEAHNFETDRQALTKPALFTICAEWLVVCDYVRARLSQIERELQMPTLFHSKGKGIRPLERLHIWRSKIPIFKDMVTETLDQALPAAARLTSRNPTASRAPISPISTDQRSIVFDTSGWKWDDITGYEDIVPDFQRVLTAIQDLQERVDRLSTVVISNIGIDDSHRSLEEARNSARLTWLATIFVPLSLVSSLYSMTEDISSLRATVGWYFATAIPVTIVMMIALAFMNYVLDKEAASEDKSQLWWRKAQRALKMDKRKKGKKGR